MGREIDPSDIGKYPSLIKKAQVDMANTDVLVCGTCNQTFHFIEAFQKHKTEECEKSTFKECRESKPKVWAFLLWKASQVNNANTNSWKLYQSWIKLDDAIRETWIVAGRTIQSFARMGQGSLQEMPVKITKTVVDTAAADSGPEIKSNFKQQLKPVLPIINKSQVERKIETKNDTSIIFDTVKQDKQPVVKKQILRSPLTKIATPTVNKNANRTARRTLPGSTDTEEEVVEKILAKRFNPRQKEHEYLVKWENFTHEQNTWEQQAHLKNCPQLLETFEKQLARQKEQRAAKQAAEQAAAKNNIPTIVSTPQPPSQVQRNAKARVKQWVNEDHEALAAASANKRKADDSDFEKDIEMTSPPTKILKTVDHIKPRVQAAPPGRIVANNKVAEAKVNGNSKAIENSSADVVITNLKEGKQTGIVKKPGVVISPSTRGDAQIRVVQKGESASSGVVRIGGAQLTKNTQRINPTMVKSSVPMSISAHAKKPTPQQVAKEPQQKLMSRPILHPGNKTTIISGQTSIQRSSMSPVKTAVHNLKPVMSRGVRSAPNSAGKEQTAQEKKIAALTRHGDLKITRKTAPNTQAFVQQTIQKESEDSFVSDGFDDSEVSMTGEDTPQELTLCPITGKVLGQADSELVEEVESDKKQKDAKAEQQTAVLADDNDIQFMTNEDGTPLMVTGEDGTVYQVAGKNEQGQTVLIAQGSDGEQQCVYVAADEGEDENMLTLDTAIAEAVQPQQITSEQFDESQQYVLKEDEATDVNQPLTIATESESQDGQITAEVVQAELPSPGGTRRVVLLLPDGSFMMTEVSDEQYQTLNLVT